MAFHDFTVAFHDATLFDLRLAEENLTVAFQLVAACLDSYSNTVNHERWTELKRVAAKNLRGEEPEPEPAWEEDEPVYDGLEARGRVMEKVMDEEVANDQRQALKRGVGDGSAPPS